MSRGAGLWIPVWWGRGGQAMGVPCMVGMTPELGPYMGLSLNRQTDVTENNTSLVGDNNCPYHCKSLHVLYCSVGP